jgi:hypothetical protein
MVIMVILYKFGIISLVKIKRYVTPLLDAEESSQIILLLFAFLKLLHSLSCQKPGRLTYVDRYIIRSP